MKLKKKQNNDKEKVKKKSVLLISSEGLNFAFLGIKADSLNLIIFVNPINRRTLSCLN